jgi:hypothetical protein
MMMALIAPELMVTWTMRQWFSARQLTRKFEELEYYPRVGLESKGESCFWKLHLTTHCKCLFLRFLRFFRLLLVMLAKGVSSVFPRMSIKVYFLNQSEGKPDSCSPKC